MPNIHARYNRTSEMYSESKMKVTDIREQLRQLKTKITIADHDKYVVCAIMNRIIRERRLAEGHDGKR